MIENPFLILCNVNFIFELKTLLYIVCVFVIFSYNYLHYWEVEVVLQREQYPVKHRAMCDAACALLSYIGGIFEALSSSSHDRQTHSSWDDEMTSDRESDLVEDLDAEDEESDEDDSVSFMGNKAAEYIIYYEEYYDYF